ncbi:PaaI family thioesterase [Allosphingosinicella indica]|uniref:Acyl-coenzyme A thioesterase PaaI, contains HGG motif n=1 Tax=Allosphingosinicella indica TaxID=941907 RepID=A0A1X7G2B5_9SPHN|nr:PaaI family thioesterase [Allosphingosinicella indica]SMF62755.1 Acyl-coenzyme A thioesterase PaaI, contains HGG motif [Allosphingosinicella indica]
MSDIHPLIRHEAHPDHPGWMSWAPPDDSRFNGAIGELLVRAEGPGAARCRMFPTVAHANLAGLVHGGAILAFVDFALFAGGHMAGAAVATGVTLDFSMQFLAPGVTGKPLDTRVELLRETGRLAFLRGTVEQEDVLVAAWSATLRKGAHKA